MPTFIKGNYRKSIYENATGYVIGLFRVVDTNDEELAEYIGRTITFTGYFHELNEQDTYMFYGKKVIHQKYGEQFQVDNYERVKPEEKDAIIDFLTSGLFKGIGDKKAKAIVDVLGNDTLKIILENPNNLILIPGITQKNIETLHNKLKEYEESYETIIYLTELGFSRKDSMLVYNFYKKQTRSIIDEDIYLLINDIQEITFKKIDVIALNSGIEKDSIIRIKASILYIINEVCNTYGHSYIYKEELLNYLPRVLGVTISSDKLEEAIEELVMTTELEIRDDRYYLRDMYHAETYIVKRLRSLANEQVKTNNDLDEKINEIESFLEIKYNKDQIKAIKESYINNFLIITGGPGTGKTTIMKAITELYRQENKYSYDKLKDRLVLLAPTGRAAKRMSEATLLPASTIHRFLRWNKESNKFQVNEYNKSNAEFVIIDESSMIDTYLMDSLLRGLNANCKILLVGDEHQLPSVGPGQVLHDLIESEMLPVVELKELYRQSKNSNIISLAYDVRNKEINESIFNISDDLTFIKCTDDEVINNICEISRTYIDLSYKKFQILAPMYKGINGIDNINNYVQEIFNKKDKNKNELKIGDTTFREEDKVIQLTNMPDENVYNGDIGLIDMIKNNPNKEIRIDFDNNVVKYTPSNFNNFRLAYSISIHKSQGSEFDIVILPIVRSYNKMLYQKLVYTAVTRAKKKLFIIGDITALSIAVNNTKEDIRRTTIKDYLINGIK